MMQRRLSITAGAEAGIHFPPDSWDNGAPGNPVGLPSGEFEIPVLIRERGFEGEIDPFMYIDELWETPFFDDAETDDLDWPELDVRPAIYRFRLVNGCAARFLDLDLSAGRKFFQIGAHGVLFDAPVSIDRLLMAPGERVDILVDFRLLGRGGSVFLRNRAPIMFPAAALPLRREPVLQFRMMAAATCPPPAPGQVMAVPAHLRGGTGQPPPLNQSAAANRRSLAAVEQLAS